MEGVNPPHPHIASELGEGLPNPHQVVQDVMKQRDLDKLSLETQDQVVAKSELAPEQRETVSSDIMQI